MWHKLENPALTLYLYIEVCNWCVSGTCTTNRSCISTSSQKTSCVSQKTQTRSRSLTLVLLASLTPPKTPKYEHDVMYNTDCVTVYPASLQTPSDPNTIVPCSVWEKNMEKPFHHCFNKMWLCTFPVPLQHNMNQSTQYAICTVFL